MSIEVLSLSEVEWWRTGHLGPSRQKKFQGRTKKHNSVQHSSNQQPARFPAVKMRAKRSKKYRKLMHQYEMTFGFHEPYQVLGTLRASFLTELLADLG